MKTSILTFNLNESEIVRIKCTDGQDGGNKIATVTDLGYYAKAPTNLTTTFNASGVTLEWEDTDNNCTSTEYQVTLNGTSTSVLAYNTNKTTIRINSNELNTTETYTYTVGGWNEQLSNISKPFTLTAIEVMSVTINTTNTTDPCKNNSCCADVTLNIILASLELDVKHPSQYYNISYNSNTGNIPATYEVIDYDKTVWTGSGLKYNETYCFTVTPMNYFSTGKPINNDTTTEYPCRPSENKCGIKCIIAIGCSIGGVLIIVLMGSIIFT
uniref:Fibronectin type-III domain-containing protein n=2 Tax=Amphimedon queenslandica TaxID=400682 RepID=A0AAN0K4M6_AMPQE